MSRKNFDSVGLTWCESDVKRLISPYPAHKKTDDVLARLGEDFYHDSVHRFDVQQHAIAAGLPADAAGEDAAGLPAVAAGGANAQKEADGSSDDEDDSNDEREDFSTTAVGSDAVAVTAPCEDGVPVRTDADEQVELVMDTIHAIQGHLTGLRAIGCTKGVQCLELELQKAKRKLRSITGEKKAVFDTFSRLRHAEEARRLENVRATAERKERWRSAQKVIAEKNAAAIKLQAKKRQLLQLENVAACKHAVRNFTLDELGKGAKNAGGAKGKRIAGTSLSVLLGSTQDSPQVKKMIGCGSRKRGTKLCLRSTGLIGLSCSQNGCKACWRTHVATLSPFSCMPKLVAYSQALRPYRSQAGDQQSRSRFVSTCSRGRSVGGEC